jgi:hypothetical protein
MEKKECINIVMILDWISTVVDKLFVTFYKPVLMHKVGGKFN